MAIKSNQPYSSSRTSAIVSRPSDIIKKKKRYTQEAVMVQAPVYSMGHVPTDPAILIVENDEETRELYADALSPVDAVVIEAGNPYEAFEQLERHAFSLILTDLHMPGGGIEFVANLRGVDVLCPIIVITGLAGHSVRDAAMAAGATLFLEKPIRTKQLREIVNRFLSSTPTIA